MAMKNEARPGGGFLSGERAQAWLLALVLLAQAAVYLPFVGRGFVSDDFIWLRESLHDGRIDLPRTFFATTGFFRPMVGLSFALQRLLHGLDPRPFGLFNLLLHLLNVILAFRLLRRWDRTRPLAAWGALLFALSLKPAGMAVGWISGRSDLLFSFFTLLAFASCPIGGRTAPGPFALARYLPCTALFLAALLSKETAVAAPLFVLLFYLAGLEGGPLARSAAQRLVRGLRAAAPFLLSAAIYFLLRFRSDAFTPASAPAYYRFSLSPLRFLKNLGEYVTRSALLDILLLLLWLGFLLFRRRRPAWRRGAADREVIVAGLLWFLCFLLPCLFLEARSDLYAYLPQLGLHAAFLAWLAGHFPLATESRRLAEWPRSLSWPLILLLGGWSVVLGLQARARSLPARAGAEFSRQMAACAAKLPPGKRVLVVDAQAGERTAPSRVVGYGLEAMLSLLAPGKELRGEFVAINEAGRLTAEAPKTCVPFLWENGQLWQLRLSRQARPGKPVRLVMSAKGEGPARASAGSRRDRRPSPRTRR